jgi:crotonobetainyl-CoA:carnitine CoA-transferase CaiB-like acyl-CoA transferase
MIHRGMIAELDYGPLGTVKQIGVPFQMSRTPATLRWLPRYGEHTGELLEELEFGAAEIEALRRDGTCE